MHLALRFAVLAAVLCLSACGGGSDAPATTSSSTDAPAAGARLTGVVAVGAPLAGATVESWCADGTAGPTASTSPGGVYELQMPQGCSGPWILRATGSGKVLLSYGGGAGTTTQILNITTLTDLVVQMVAHVPPQADDTAWAAGLRVALAQDWSTSEPQVRDVVSAWLGGSVTPAGLIEGFTGSFVPALGDRMDDLLERLDRLRGEVPVAALVEQLKPQGGDLAKGQPWKTLFGAAPALALSASNCTTFGNPVAPATITLRMQDQDLAVEVASTDAAVPGTFTVGPSVSSDFQIVLRGNDPYVSVSGSQSGAGSLQVFTDAGTPKISFSVAGVTATTCTLDSPLRRTDLVAFQPAARIRSVVPAAGASGDCAASARGPAYSYAISPMGDVRFNGTSLPADWLDAPSAYYSESLQFGMGGPGASYQVQLSALETGQGIQPYYFSTVPYAVNCTSYNP